MHPAQCYKCKTQKDGNKLDVKGPSYEDRLPNHAPVVSPLVEFRCMP